MERSLDRSLARFVYLLVGVASIFIIILGIQSSAYVINSILLAAIIAIAVVPIPQRLIARGWNPSLALIVTLLVVVGVLALILFVTWVSIGRVTEALAGGGVSSSQASEGQITELFTWLRGLGGNENTAQMLTTVVSVVGQFIGQAATVLMILIFMLSAIVTTPISERLTQIDDAAGMDRFTELTQDTQQYISITTAINAVVGLLNTFFFWMVGVEFAILWGLLAWFMGYIPVVGFWIALIPPVLLAWAQLGLPTAILVFVAIVVINGAAENFIKPRMMGESLDISPLVVFISVVFWGWVLGGAGAILAVPLTLLVLSTLRSFEATRWIAALAESAPATEGERRIAFNRLGNLWNGAKHALRGDDHDDDLSDEQPDSVE